MSDPFSSMLINPPGNTISTFPFCIHLQNSNTFILISLWVTLANFIFTHSEDLWLWVLSICALDIVWNGLAHNQTYTSQNWSTPVHLVQVTIILLSFNMPNLGSDYCSYHKCKIIKYAAENQFNLNIEFIEGVYIIFKKETHNRISNTQTHAVYPNGSVTYYHSFTLIFNSDYKFESSGISYTFRHPKTCWQRSAPRMAGIRVSPMIWPIGN